MIMIYKLDTDLLAPLVEFLEDRIVEIDKTQTIVTHLLFNADAVVLSPISPAYDIGAIGIINPDKPGCAFPLPNDSYDSVVFTSQS